MSRKKSKNAPNPGPARPKKTFYTRATVLHILSLVVSLALVCYLSSLILSRTLVSQSPSVVEGWVLVKDVESGKMQRVEFTLPAGEAAEIARIIDRARYDSGKSTEKYGEFRFTFASRQKRKFTLVPDGVRDSIGFRRHKTLNIDEIRGVIMRSAKPVEPVGVEKDPT